MIERDEGYDIKILLQVITKSESQEKEKRQRNGHACAKLFLMNTRRHQQP